MELKAFLIRCDGQQYTALARSSCQAVAQAIALHGARRCSARPLPTGHSKARP